LNPHHLFDEDFFVCMTKYYF